jgi:hypothetical protein
MIATAPAGSARKNIKIWRSPIPVAAALGRRASPLLTGTHALLLVCLGVGVMGVMSVEGSPSGSIAVGSAVVGCVIGRLLPRRGPGDLRTDQASSQGTGTGPRWTLDPDSPNRVKIVKAALEYLGNANALGRNPLVHIPGLSGGSDGSSDVRNLLIDVVAELATSSEARDAEAGRLLLDYYVKRVGSHEVIMERLHLSRPTFYRRLQRGLDLVAGRVDDLAAFASCHPMADSPIPGRARR